MRRVTLIILGLSLAPLASRGVAAGAPATKSGEQLAQAFGAREYVQQISLSPDGTKIAMITAANGRGAALTVADISKGGDLKAILSSSGNPDRLTDCHWATNTRLVCRIYVIDDRGDEKLGFDRLIAINEDGSGIKLLSTRTNDRQLGVMQSGGSLIDWGTGDTGSALMTHTYVPENGTGTLIEKNREGVGVDLVNITSLARKVVEQPRQDATSFLSDGNGIVRVMGVQPAASNGYDGSKVLYAYRTAGSRDWKPLSTLTVSAGRASGFEPFAVDAALDLVYGMESHNGHEALYSVALDGSLTKKLVVERPDVDIDGLIKIGRRQRVVAATYVTDRREAEFFDPALKSLRNALAKVLPGRLITFVDASADESKLLLFAGSDVDPGRYYLFDKKTHGLAEILPERPQLVDVPLATAKSITYQAADGTKIPAYLTLPAGSDGRHLPAIVMPHGGPGARDEWGFDWLAQFFAARGFAVIQPEFRGSTGFGEAWYQKNGFQGWESSIGDVNDAGRWLVKSGIADPTKLAIVGWSYGGYAALQSSVLDPNLFKAIVAVAPVTDLDALREEHANFTDYNQVDAMVGHGPWVSAGSPARNAAKIKAPVLLFHADHDLNVGVRESRLMADRIKSAGGKVEYIEFKNLDHQLEDDGVRATMLAKSDAFLRASMGMTP